MTSERSLTKKAGSSFAPGPNSDPLVGGVDPWIRIRTKISWICNTAFFVNYSRAGSEIRYLPRAVGTWVWERTMLKLPARSSSVARPTSPSVRARAASQRDLCFRDKVWYRFSEGMLQLQYSTFSVADPGSGAFLTPRSGMGKKSGSGSGMNNLDHISESLK